MSSDRKRAPYGKRGLNEGVLATTNGALDDIIGISPFGIYCKGCKTKIAFSTFKNHIRDAHSECFTPQSVNYAAVSREYERLVSEKLKACEDIEQFVTGEVCDRFQCTSCSCLFDNKSNAKRHFLSMKTGCSDASLTIVKCRRTICYRAVTLTHLEVLIADSAENKRAREAKEANGTNEEEESLQEAELDNNSKVKKESSPKSDKKKSPKKSSPKRKNPAPNKKTKTEPDSKEKTKPSPSPVGVRSSSRARKKRRSDWFVEI